MLPAMYTWQTVGADREWQEAYSTITRRNSAGFIIWPLRSHKTAHHRSTTNEFVPPINTFQCLLIDRQNNPGPIGVFEITIMHQASVFVDKLVTPCGRLSNLLTMNGPQFVYRSFPNSCAHLGVKHMTILSHLPQASTQPERISKTISPFFAIMRWKTIPAGTSMISIHGRI